MTAGGSLRRSWSKRALVSVIACHISHVKKMEFFFQKEGTSVGAWSVVMNSMALDLWGQTEHNSSSGLF